MAKWKMTPKRKARLDEMYDRMMDRILGPWLAAHMEEALRDFDAA